MLNDRHSKIKKKMGGGGNLKSFLDVPVLVQTPVMYG